ncbi:MAG: PIN domain-containing protein [Pirellulales bacterium]|nr:PIN domain-containing protein [Pirellulales bacterium]
MDISEFRTVFLDTWAFVAIGNRRDVHHPTAITIYRELKRRRIQGFTTDFVLDETITMLFARTAFHQARQFVSSILEAAAGGSIHIERIDAARFAAAWELRKTYVDKPSISFTDLTSIVVIQERAIPCVVSGDRHFDQLGIAVSRIPADD